MWNSSARSSSKLRCSTRVLLHAWMCSECCTCRVDGCALEALPLLLMTTTMMIDDDSVLVLCCCCCGVGRRTPSNDAGDTCRASGRRQSTPIRLVHDGSGRRVVSVDNFVREVLERVQRVQRVDAGHVVPFNNSTKPCTDDSIQHGHCTHFHCTRTPARTRARTNAYTHTRT